MKKLFLILGLFLTFSANAQLWDSLRGGLGDSPRVLYADTLDTYLYVAGRFAFADTTHCKGIARWNGTQWDSLGAGIDGLDANVYPQNTLAITRYNNELYAGGSFHSAGNVWTGCLAKWNGAAWDSLSIRPFPTNASVVIWSLASINGKLYMGGVFNTVAGITCHYIAQWDGANWTSLNFPNQVDAVSVNAITEYNGELYAAGSFCNSIGDTISNILRWDGTNWHSVGGGIKGGGLTHVETMCVYNGELYVAGSFAISSGNAGNNIQKWNGTNWNGVGGGTSGANGQIHNLVVYNSKLYALGVFDYAGGVPANFFASWNGTDWCGVGSAFDNTLNYGCVYHDSLFIGGGFWTIAGDSILRIAKWVGGNYTDTCGFLSTGINDQLQESFSANVFPNPATTSATFQITNSQGEKSLIIYDNLGKEIWRKETTENQIEFSTEDFAPGLYFYRIEQEGAKMCTGKLIIEK
jgi:hypothetical protein